VKTASLGYCKRYTLTLLETRHHCQQIVRPRIALGAQHAHQALRILLDVLGQGVKANGRVHVVPQQQFTKAGLAWDRAADDPKERQVQH